MRISEAEILIAYKHTLENNFYFFFKETWHILEPAQELNLNWHHKYLCDLLQKEAVRIANREPKDRDIVINIPFRSTKSTIVSQMYNAWAWIKYPELRFVTSSYAARLSTRDAKKTRDIINSRWYQELFSDRFQWTSDQNVKTEYENTKTGKRFVTSTDSNITGEGGDILIFDDPNNPKKNTDLNLENINNTYDDVFYSRLNNDKIGIRIIIQQRIHENDLTGHILKKYPESINHIVMPAEISPDVNPVDLTEHYKNGYFWEWKFGKESLKQWEKVLSSTAYTGQLQQNPQAKAGNIILKEWFNVISEKALPFNIKDQSFDVWIDGAYTDKTANDPTGIMSCLLYEHNLYILNSVDKWLEMYELLKYIPKYAKANHYTAKSKMYIEPKASGKSIRSMINKMGYNCIEIDNKVVSIGKMGRVKDAEPTLESGKIFLIEGSWNKKLIDQCSIFPNGKHDEHVDNLTYAINHYFINVREEFLSL